MPRPGKEQTYEKARDFKGAIKRLFTELNTYKILIIFAFTLAILGAILSILAPNRLSSLTDEISAGLVINQDNLEALNKKASENLNEEKLKEILPELLSPDVSEENIKKILTDEKIKDKDKAKFQEILNKMKENQNEAFSELSSLPNSILEKIFKNTKYQGKTITTEDKIDIIKISKDSKDINLSKTLQNIFFKEITIDRVKITPNDQ